MITITKVSKYKLGVGLIRAEKRGNSGKILYKDFWKPQNHAQMNNINGADYIKFCLTRENFEQLDWKTYRQNGLVGIAIWITDIQWQRFLRFTMTQWQNRIII